MNDKYLKAMKSLSVQALYNSKSGHPGMAMSASNITYVLYTKHINISKENPKWLNRDRFVLSGGHGCLRVYSIFHFANLIDKNEIKKFRLGSKWYPGHPEFEDYNYVDASTGPLGQGVANGVGMALAQKYLSQRWKHLSNLVDHYTYIVCGDGDLQEGISYEAMSIAGRLKLNKLIMLYDSNDYQLDSAVKDVNNENMEQRVLSQNWQYIRSSNDLDDINEAINKAKKLDGPVFIEVKTIIGEGISSANSNKAHGAAINENELKTFNDYYDVDYKDFKFHDDIYEHFNKEVVVRGNKKYSSWEKELQDLKSKYPEDAKQLLDNFNNKFENFSQMLNLQKLAKVNDASKAYLKSFFEQLSQTKDIITLSADLASTTNCKISADSFNKDEQSPYIMVGVREFSMSAIQNGILYHGGLISFAGTFLSFIDYAKSSLRVGAMAKLPSNYILTHDTYKVGADGPTHQPYDQLPMLRAIDNVYDLRPCDEKETIASLKLCLANKNKTYCLILTRQPMPSTYKTNATKVSKGAYLINEESSPDLTIIASGSEVELAMNVANELKNEKINVNVISCPSAKLFLEQSDKYKQELLKSKHGLVCIEASSDNIWYELLPYVKNIKLIKATKFGASMDGNKLYEKMGFNKSNVIKVCKELLNE